LGISVAAVAEHNTKFKSLNLIYILIYVLHIFIYPRLANSAHISDNLKNTVLNSALAAQVTTPLL
jgi:hypothetical protein